MPSDVKVRSATRTSTGAMSAKENAEVLTVGRRVLVDPCARFHVRLHAAEEVNVWVYKIAVVNNLDYPIQLIGRHWDIKPADGKNEVVDAETVAGKWPVLWPGVPWEYVSAVPLRSRRGTMGGWFRAQPLHSRGKVLHIEVPAFDLSPPGTDEELVERDVEQELPEPIERQLKEEIAKALNPNNHTIPPMLLDTHIFAEADRQIVVDCILSRWRFFNRRKQEMPDLWPEQGLRDQRELVCSDVYVRGTDFESSIDLNVEIINSLWFKPLKSDIHRVVKYSDDPYYADYVIIKGRDLPDIDSALQIIATSLGVSVAHVRRKLGMSVVASELTGRETGPRPRWEGREDGDLKLTPEEFLDMYYAAEKAAVTPRPVWKKDGPYGDKPAEFIAMAFRPEMMAGTLHRGLVGQEQPDLAVKLASWLRHHKLPKGVDIPTKPEWNTLQLEHFKKRGRPVRAARRRTNLSRLYDAKRQRDLKPT